MDVHKAWMAGGTERKQLEEIYEKANYEKEHVLETKLPLRVLRGRNQPAKPETQDEEPSRCLCGNSG